MEIRVRQGSITEQAADLIVVNLFQGVIEPGGATGAVDGALGGAIREVIAAGDFVGKSGETLVLYTRGALPSPRVLVVGLGRPEAFNRSVVRDAAATAARKARDLGAKAMASVVHGAGIGGLAPQEAAQAFSEGAWLGLYRFQGHWSEPPESWKPDPETLTIVEFDAEKLPGFGEGVRRGEAIAQGVYLARDLVSEPANYMTPTIMAQRATAMADETGLKIQVLGPDQINELGMGIFMAVAKQSEEPARFIILEHNADRADLPTVVLAGKGVTFDSGGISLKPGKDLWHMKHDMAGAAAVIGALSVAARTDMPVHVVGLTPCAENLPGGRAQKPGDVFTGMTGKTMEVISTDAEGRMLLADALAYAGRYRPHAVADIATLTGAQAVALGPLAAGFFANDDSLASRLSAAAEVSDERLWRLPLYDEYKASIKSAVADVKNSGSRAGGIGSSAKFLEHFTEDYPWAHIDMASMAWADEDKPAIPKGGTGYAVRLFTAFLEAWGK